MLVIIGYVVAMGCIFGVYIFHGGNIGVILTALPFELITILGAVDQVATTKYVLSDLVRSRLSYLAFSALLPLRMTNSFAWHDGRISIRKAFTVADGQKLITAAGLTGKATIRRFLPAHLAIVGVH